MVAQLLGLRLQLLANGFRRSVWQLLGILLATVVGIGLIMLIGSGLIALRSAPDDLARNLLVLAGSFVVLGYVLLPLVFGVDHSGEEDAEKLPHASPESVGQQLQP
jgi:ABC-2 type transport system permease protein